MANPMLSRITMQIIMVFGPSMSKGSRASSLLGLVTMDLSLTSAFGSAFGPGSICLGAVFGSALGAAFGAGLGCLFSAGLVSALLDALLTSLDSTLFSWAEGALSGLCSMTLGSGVTALEDILDTTSSSSAEMRLFLVDTGAEGAAAMSGSLASSNFWRGLISKSEPCSFLML